MTTASAPKEDLAAFGIQLMEDVVGLEALLSQAIERRDKWMQTSHGIFSYAELVRLSNPDQNGGHKTRKLSRSRIIQIVQEGKP